MDYVVSGLVDFDDVSYDSHADLLYELAGQIVNHLGSYLPDEYEVRKVLATHQREIARFVHVQMQEHYWEKGYEVKISKGFAEFKPSAYTASVAKPVLDYRQVPADKSNMAKFFWRLQAVSLPGTKVPVRQRAEAVRHLGARGGEVVQAGERTVPDLLQVRRRPPRIPA